MTLAQVVGRRGNAVEVVDQDDGIEEQPAHRAKGGGAHGGTAWPMTVKAIHKARWCRLPARASPASAAVARRSIVRLSALQTAPEETRPKSTPEKDPGQTDDHTRTQPRQQNRANEATRQLEMLAAEMPMLGERSGG